MLFIFLIVFESVQQLFISACSVNVLNRFSPCVSCPLHFKDEVKIYYKKAFQNRTSLKQKLT